MNCSHRLSICLVIALHLILVRVVLGLTAPTRINNYWLTAVELPAPQEDNIHPLHVHHTQATMIYRLYLLHEVFHQPTRLLHPTSNISSNGCRPRHRQVATVCPYNHRVPLEERRRLPPMECDKEWLCKDEHLRSSINSFSHFHCFKTGVLWQSHLLRTLSLLVHRQAIQRRCKL